MHRIIPSHAELCSEQMPAHLSSCPAHTTVSTILSSTNQSKSMLIRGVGCQSASRFGHCGLGMLFGLLMFKVQVDMTIIWIVDFAFREVVQKGFYLRIFGKFNAFPFEIMKRMKIVSPHQEDYLE